MTRKIFLGILIGLTSCTSASSKKESWDFENDPRITEESKKSIRERRSRDTLSLSQIEEKYNQLSKINKFYFIHEVLEHAITEKNWVKTENYALQYLSLAESFKDNWNYGNALFDAPIALSISAFNTNKKKEAREFLVEASKTPGSPQLNSFGPFNHKIVTSHLEDLLSEGEKNAVLEFAANCKLFIEKPLASNKKLSEVDIKNAERVKEINRRRIHRFIMQVSENQKPDFNDL